MRIPSFDLFGRPEFLRPFHGWPTVFWPPFTALAFAFGWLSSVVFVSAMSMAALFLGSFSSWQAARVESKQDEEVTSVIEELRDEVRELRKLVASE